MSDKKHFQLDLVRRPRRLRQSQFLRDLVEETLNPAHLIQPVFISINQLLEYQLSRCQE